MKLNEYLVNKRRLILKALAAFIDHKTSELQTVNIWGKENLEIFSKYIPSGKLLRGCLVYLGYNLYSNKSNKNLDKLALAMEFIQTSLLFHDDIADNDDKRRGMDTLHKYFAMILKHDVRHPVETGKNLSMCSGDFGYFTAIELITRTSIDNNIKSSIIQTVSEEIEKVCLAQMQDIHLGDSRKDIRLNEILNIYRFKTGRYSVALPLIVGALLAGKKAAELTELWEFGENLGILFQIKDDQLSIWGNERVTGKPVGNDIKKDKKTIFRHLLFTYSSHDDKQKLRHIFGNPKCTHDDIKFIGSLLNQKVIAEKIFLIEKPLRDNIANYLKTLTVRQNQELLSEFAYLIKTRTK